MGACCSCHRGGPRDYGSYIVEGVDEKRQVEENEILYKGDLGARVRLHGSSKHVSMYSKQGKKGTNQDAMTVWENFTGDKDMIFVGVFDGHGPSGHKVARYVRDHLPSRISTPGKRSSFTGSENGGDEGSNNNVSGDANENEESKDSFYSSWKTRILRAFKDTDEELEADASIENYCSGTTSVSAYKKGQDLIIANLGDSRAVLCSTDENNNLVAEQLTIDLKPNIPSEADRITSCQGRVMAMQEEPNVYRIWMPDEDCPGLAMSRAFGDFCLKDFGLISTPQLFYRKLTPKDEFIVLATDGIWDVLPNEDVVAVVASTRNRSMAAKMVVERAIRAWRFKYPCAKVDDCAVVCLFFNRPRPLTKSYSERSHLSLNYSEMGARKYGRSKKNDDALDTVLNYNLKGEVYSSARANSRNQRNAGRKYEFVKS